MLLIYKKRDGTDVTVRLSEESLRDPVTIGRGQEADVVLEDSRASRVHAAILRWDDTYVVRDINSANGVYVNDSRTKLSFIKPGDALRIADTDFRLISSGSQDDATMEGVSVEP